MQKTLIPKRIAILCMLVLSGLCLATLSLKSTSFQYNQQNNKRIISMKPIYSHGDPTKYQQKYTNINQNKIRSTQYYSTKPQKFANNQPLAIIPNYLPQRSQFSRRYISKNNSYLKPNKSIASYNAGKAYQGRIPSQGKKHLKPLMTQHHINKRDKQYASITR
ncbi:MAG: hypothetical protein ACJARD_000948 [Alphaproteobacteria bacterium]|jgi:hypothetical protein